MAYGNVGTVTASIEAYTAGHAEIEKSLGDVLPEGLIFHAARATDSGFEIYEVWESKEFADKFNQDIVAPALARLGADIPDSPPDIKVFEPVGIMAARSQA
jgi:hypothetical protein